MVATGRVLFGLDERLVLHLSDPAKGAILVTRALSLRNFLHEEESLEIHRRSLGHRLVVGHIQNYGPLLESFLGVVPRKKAALKNRAVTLDKQLSARGFAICTGLELDSILKTGGAPRWVHVQYMLEAPPHLEGRAKNFRIVWGRGNAGLLVGKTQWHRLREVRTEISRSLINDTKAPDSKTR